MSSRTENPATVETAGRPPASLKMRALQEAKSFLGIFIYLWILLSLFALHETIVLEQHGIPYSPLGFAFLNALVLGKVILIADALNVARGLENQRLVYSILYKSVVFAALLVGLRVIEEILHALVTGRGALQTLPVAGPRGLLVLIATGVIAAVALIPFFAFREVARVIGKDRLRSLFLERGAGEHA